jgi:hypothetical protein
MNDTEPDATTTSGPPTTPAEPTATEPTGPARAPRWRRILAVVLLVIGFILLPLSAIAVWSHNQLTNTDRYVDTVSPLASNHDIQEAVARTAVQAIFSSADTKKQIQDALPKRAKFLGGPVTGAVQTFATNIAEKFLASDQFQKLWDGVNRRAHSQLDAILTDTPSEKGGALAVKNGQVTLDLNPVIKKVQARLVDAGLSFLSDVKVPPVKRTIAIIDSEGLSEARSYVSLLDTLAWVLPVLALVAFVASALIVPNHRRATIRAAIVLAASCAFTLALFAIVRSLYLDAVKEQNRDAASAMYDILIRNLRYGLIILLVLGVVVALVAFFLGRSRSVTPRAIASSGFAESVARHRRALELGVVAIAVVVLVLADQPGISTVVWLVVACLVVVAFVEFLSRGVATNTDEGARA